MKNNMMQNQADATLQEDFENLTGGIQRILDLGSEALAEAEAKTEEVAMMDPESSEYERAVQEVKDAQARAGNAFKQAEDLITAANELLPNDK